MVGVISEISIFNQAFLFIVTPSTIIFQIISYYFLKFTITPQFKFACFLLAHPVEGLFWKNKTNTFLIFQGVEKENNIQVS